MSRDESPRTVGILIFPEVEILDFCGPFEVFASASWPSGNEAEPPTHLFDVITIAQSTEVVRCRGGLLVQPNHTLENHPPLDIMVIPGGYGTRREQENPIVLDWIARQRQQGALTTSVCTGAFLLGAAGLLHDKRSTTHWTTIEDLRQFQPATTVLADTRVVDEGEIITSAGVSAGIDMALHIVRRLHGADVARATARDMEYDWRHELSEVIHPGKV